MRYRKEISSMKAATPQNGQIHLKNSSATTGELFEYVWPFCGVDADRVNGFYLPENISTKKCSNSGFAALRKNLKNSGEFLEKSKHSGKT